MNSRKTPIDSTDRKIARLLAADGRMSWAELASALGLSGPSAAERVKKLEQRKVIRGYTAILDAEQLGAEVSAFVAVRLEQPRHRRGFIARVNRLDGVLECHHVAGDDDYFLKVRVASLRELDKLVSEDVKAVDGVAGTRTIIVMSTLKETLTPAFSAEEPE